jgi:nitrate/nitrite-specific signal transduction histidine kinase
MILRVTDDGIGLSDELKPKQGLGFHIMNYRAQLIGGRLEIDSSKHAGMRVSCHLPNRASRSRKSGGKENGQNRRFARTPRGREPLAV